MFFFFSVDKDSRPKKRSIKYKPRNKAQSSSVYSSPSSADRPQKRSRDCGSFNFDLNQVSNGSPSDSSHPVTLDNSVAVNADNQCDGVHPHTSGQLEVGEGLDGQEESLEVEVADTFDN
ncbi:hypothetical protein Hanom_Chr05g00439611 [Helianthus anomalus]